MEGHTKGAAGAPQNAYAYFDAYKTLGQTTCGPQRPVTGWSGENKSYSYDKPCEGWVTQIDRSWTAEGVQTSNAAFGTGTGIYTIPEDGGCITGRVSDSI